MPKGGVKHQPGRGHDTKSGPRKKKRFQERAAKKRAEAQKSLATQWDEWDAMPPEAQQLRPVLEYEAERARKYYESAKWLMELIKEDSHATL